MYHGYTEFGGEGQRRDELLAEKVEAKMQDPKVIINENVSIRIKSQRSDDFTSTIKDLLTIVTIFVGAYLVFLLLRAASLNLYHLIFDR